MTCTFSFVSSETIFIYSGHTFCFITGPWSCFALKLSWFGLFTFSELCFNFWDNSQVCFVPLIKSYTSRLPHWFSLSQTETIGFWPPSYFPLISTNLILCFSNRYFLSKADPRFQRSSALAKTIFIWQSQAIFQKIWPFWLGLILNSQTASIFAQTSSES